jgi:hypothetical protein
VTVEAYRRAWRRLRVEGDRLPLAWLVFGTVCLLPDGHRLVSEPHLSSWLLLWFPVGLLAQCEAPSSGGAAGGEDRPA